MDYIDICLKEFNKLENDFRTFVSDKQKRFDIFIERTFKILLAVALVALNIMFVLLLTFIFCVLTIIWIYAFVMDKTSKEVKK